MSGPRVGGTGTRTLRPSDRPVLIEILDTIKAADPDEVTTGACTGFDHNLGWRAYQALPHAHHRVIVPANHSRVAVWWEGLKVEVIEMPPGSTYRDRNARILDFTGELYACAAAPEDSPESQRSGTWMTVRMARDREIPVLAWVLP